MHEVLVNRLGGLSLPRKSVVRLTDRPDMTLDVYRGRKTTIEQFFLHLFQITSNVLSLPCNILCGRQETRHGMAPRRLVSQLVMSSKWPPKILILISKEYLRAKLKAVWNTLGSRCTNVAGSMGTYTHKRIKTLI